MLVRNNDFIELEFIAKVKETGEIFDGTTANGKNIPLKICVGEHMILEAFDKALEGKEIGKEYSLELVPEHAFGKRDNSLVKIIPISVFRKQGVNPAPGMLYNIDGILVKIISVSSGRVITDFNHPLSGKNVIYSFKIKDFVKENDEKIKILINSILRLKDKDYKIISENETKKKIVLDINNKGLAEMMKALDSHVKTLIEKSKKLLQIELSIEYG